MLVTVGQRDLETKQHDLTLAICVCLLSFVGTQFWCVLQWEMAHSLLVTFLAAVTILNKKRENS